MNAVFAKIAEAWKAVVAAAGVALLVWNQLEPGVIGFIPASWQHPLSVVIAVVTVIATYGVRNKERRRHRRVPKKA